MATQSTVLWKCGACEDCFCDLQAFAGHKCLNHQGPALTEFKNLDENAFADAEIVNTSSDQVEQVVSAIAALEENSGGSLDQDVAETTFSISGKRKRKAKPTIISINNSSLVANKKFKKGKRSLVWTYFSALDHKKAMCCICHKVIAYCGTPTNLVYHLNRFHPTESEVVKSKQAGVAKYQYLQKKIPQQSNPKFHISPAKSVNIVSAVGCGKKTIIDRIIEIVALDLLPASSIQSQGIKQVLQSIDPTCQIPDAKKIMKDLLPERYYIESKKIKDELMSSDTVHLSIELWCGYQSEYFLTMTSHFYSNFNLRCYALATTCLGKTYDSQAIATSMLSCISDWGLTDAATCIVTNGSEYLNQAVSVSSKGNITCLAHTLDGIIKDAFATSTELNKLIEKCRKLVLFLKLDDCAKQKMMETQTHNKKLKSLLRDHLEFSDSKTPNCPLKAKKDNDKYWITTFYMLQRIFTLRNVINIVLDEIPSNIQPFTENDWLAIEETISLLKAFEMVTLELCSERFPSLSKVIPIVQGLLSLVTNCSGLTITFIEKLRKNLLYRLQKKVGNMEENITLAVATVLDPRFKNIAFQSEEAVEAAVQEISCKGRKYTKQHLENNSQNSLLDTSSYTDSLWASFEKKATPKKEACQSDDIVFTELKNFFDEPLLDRKKNPSVWWRDCGSARYPTLTEIAKSVLSIPATSVPPEQVFMQQEQSYFEKRKNIKTKYVDHILFLNKNIE